MPTVKPSSRRRNGAIRARSPKFPLSIVTGCEFSGVHTLPTLAVGEAKSGGACGAVRKVRGTLRQHVGGNAHEDGGLCSCTPAMHKPPQQAFSPHISRGYTAQQNSQPVIFHLRVTVPST